MNKQKYIEKKTCKAFGLVLVPITAIMAIGAWMTEGNDIFVTDTIVAWAGSIYCLTR